MLLVVDANVLFSALISGAKTSDLMFSNRLQLVAPEFLFTEFEEHEDGLRADSSLSKDDFDGLLGLLKGEVDVVPREEFEEFLKEGNELSPDPDDTEYFAVALRFDAAIWSNDSELKKQTKVKVLSTEELLEPLES